MNLERWQFTVHLKERVKKNHAEHVAHVKEKLSEDWTNPAKEEWDKEFVWVRY